MTQRTEVRRVPNPMRVPLRSKVWSIEATKAPQKVKTHQKRLKGALIGSLMEFNEPEPSNPYREGILKRAIILQFKERKKQ